VEGGIQVMAGQPQALLSTTLAAWRSTRLVTFIDLDLIAEVV